MLLSPTTVLPWVHFDATTRAADLKSEKADQEEAAGHGSDLCCRACRHGITSQQAAVPVNGRQMHVCTNPSGVTFEFGCYSQAPGCAVTGKPTAEHTWFPGYTWQIAQCAGCGTHLGWYFRGGSGFFGLILNRLVSGSD